MGDSMEEVYKFELVNEQVFNMKFFYKYVHEYLMEQGFRSLQYGDDKVEVFYDEVRHTGGMRENRIWWRWSKGVNKYVRFVMKIDFLILAMKDVETMIEGRKTKAQQGEVTLMVSANVDIDTDKKLQNNPLAKMFSPYFMERWYKDQIDGYSEDLIDKTIKFQENIKHYLSMATTGTIPGRFHPEKGIS